MPPPPPMKDILVGWALDWLVCPRKTSWGPPVPSLGTGQPGSMELQSLQGQQSLKLQNTENKRQGSCETSWERPPLRGPRRFRIPRVYWTPLAPASFPP